MRRHVLQVTLPLGVIVIVVGAWLARGGDLNPPPGPIQPTMRSLSDIYGLLEQVDGKLDGGGGGGGCNGLLDPLFIGAGESQDVFLQVQDVEGESTDPDHVDWIDVLGVGQVLESDGPPRFGPLRVLARTDLALPAMMQASVSGRRMSPVTLDFVTQDQDRFSFMTIDLTRAIVTSLTPLYQARAYIVEFDFERIAVRYTSRDSGDTVRFCWDVGAGGPCR